MVRDAASGQPLAGVVLRVIASNSTYTAVSSADGSFLFPGLMHGSYTMTCRTDGYLPKTVSNSLMAGEKQNSVVLMEAN